MPVYEVHCCCMPEILLGTLEISGHLPSQYLTIPLRIPGELDYRYLQLEVGELYQPGKGYSRALKGHETDLPFLRQLPNFKVNPTMETIRNALENIINKVDYTNHQCGVTAPVAAAVPEEDFAAAHAALHDPDAGTPELRAALLVLLDQIDYTASACGPFEMVGACLPKEVIKQVRTALR